MTNCTKVLGVSDDSPHGERCSLPATHRIKGKLDSGLCDTHARSAAEWHASVIPIR